MDKRGYTQEELGKRVGKSREHVANTLRLLSLPENVQKLVENGTLSAGQARPLITVESNDIDKLVDKIVKENFSVRRVERLVQEYKNPVIKKPANTGEEPYMERLCMLLIRI